MRPIQFEETRKETWTHWAMKFKTDCKGKTQGLWSALDWAVKEDEEIRGSTACPWDKALQADIKLHDSFCATSSGEADLIAETVGLGGRGFKTWRRFEPSTWSPPGKFTKH